MGFTPTTNYGLLKPDRNEVDWDDEVNTNFDVIDAQMQANETAADFHVERHEDGGADALTGADIEGIVRDALAAASATIDFNGQNFTNIGDIATAANVYVPDGGTVGISGNELITFNAAGTIAFSGATLELEATTSTTGQITQAGSRLLHSYGTNNFFAGVGAGNFTLTSTQCVGVGKDAAAALTSALAVTAVGRFAAGSVTSGHYTTALGYLAGYHITTANGGTFLGPGAGYWETAANKLFIDNALRTNEADGRVKALVYGEFNAATASQIFRINGVLETLEGAKLGDNGGTDYLDVSAAGDVLFKGSAGLAFGELWVLGNAVETAIGGAGTFVQYAGFANDGASNNTTPDSTQNHITITEPGVYEVTASFHVESVGAGAADLVSIEIRTNNGTVGYGNLHSHRKLSGGGGDVGSMSVSGLAEFADNDTVEVWITNDDNPTNLLVADANIRLCQYGGATSAPSSSSSSSSSSSP